MSFHEISTSPMAVLSTICHGLFPKQGEDIDPPNYEELTYQYLTNARDAALAGASQLEEYWNEGAYLAFMLERGEPI